MTTDATPKERIEQVAADLGLAMTVQFVPFSQSRNAKDKTPSLNYKVTITRNGREVLTTDYSMGCGHCLAYKASVKELGNQNSVMRHEAIKWECENGRDYSQRALYKMSKSRLPAPELADVLYSLSSDSTVLDFATFEDFASEWGYDPDSRSAERTYRACLEIALSLRAAIGDEGLSKLAEACQDY